MKIYHILIFLIYSCSTTIAQREIAANNPIDKNTALGNYEDLLKERGITHSNKSDHNILINYFKNRLSNHLKVLTNIEDPEYKRAKNEVPFLEYGIEILSKLPNKIESYDIALRILYSLDADYLENDNYAKLGKLKLIEKLFKAQAKFDIQDNLSPDSIISANALEKVALNLNKSSSDYYSLADLKNLTPLEISKLDISKNHPKWFRNADKVDGKKHWEYMEKWVEQKVSRKFKKKKKGLIYNVKTANKILVFDGMKTNASSPKFKTKDLYGMKWKLKLGEEIHTEPILNRLYVLLGGKFNDLVYARSITDNNPSIVILNEEDGTQTCETVSNLKKLKKCFLEGHFNFDMSEYVHSYGSITEINLRGLFKTNKKFELDKLRKYIGRNFLILKESSLEYKDYPILSAGPTALSNLDATTDRVQRGLGLFHSWISNADARDGNSRSYLLKDFMNKDQYVEADHDLGASLGFMTKIGSINHYKTKDNFVKTIKKGKKILFLDLIFEHPKAWSHITYADIKWMLDKIPKLKTNEIKWAISHSALPDFMEKIIYNKMISRINSVLKIFGMNEFKENQQLSFSLKINEENAKKYNIPPYLYNKFLNESERKIDSADLLSTNNKISECSDSFWINLLEKTNHPTGLSRKLSRHNDDEGLGNCDLDKK